MITVENTMRKAEASSTTKTGKAKKPIPWLKVLIGTVIIYAVYAYFTKDKSSKNELSSPDNVQAS